MSFLYTRPAAIAAAATQFEGIGNSVSSMTTTAAGSTTGVGTKVMPLLLNPTIT